MSQSRQGSLREAWFNTFVGYWINYAANLVILPAFLGVRIGLGTNLVIGLIYTVISVARQYGIRRICNRLRTSWFA